jgi:hypothetical protein
LTQALLLNIRGERSVTCKRAFDANPSAGPLPHGAPKVCEEFRKLPDALERAGELDKQYGRNPDLSSLPMYCVVTAVKDPFDTRDMRTTASSDVAFAIDVPPFDSTIVARLRDRGRDHLREIQCPRVQRRTRRSGWTSAEPHECGGGWSGHQRMGGPGM